MIGQLRISLGPVSYSRVLNTTLITLIPKSSTANTIRDYSPISCCTTLYKIISKVLTIRMSSVMSDLVNEAQVAFVPGRFIHDNTMLAQEIIRGYGEKNLSTRWMIKMDLQKAYDSIQWDFVNRLLRVYEFPAQFVGWLMTCLTTVSYHICLNGQLTNRFGGKKGLRQGDPVSPYLFVLCMEYLSRLIGTLEFNSKYRYHPKCKDLRITHLTFTDDLLFFSKGSLNFVSALLEIF